MHLKPDHACSVDLTNIGLGPEKERLFCISCKIRPFCFCSFCSFPQDTTKIRNCFLAAFLIGTEPRVLRGASHDKEIKLPWRLPNYALKEFTAAPQLWKFRSFSPRKYNPAIARARDLKTTKQNFDNGHHIAASINIGLNSHYSLMNSIR